MVRWSLLAASAAVLVSFLSMIFVVFGLLGNSFLLSVTLLIGLMVFLSFAMGGIANGRAWGWSFLTFISLVIILYSLVLFLVFGMVNNLALLVASTVILLAISVLNFRLADEPSKGSIAPARSSPKVEVYETLDKIEPKPVQQKIVRASQPAAKAVAAQKNNLPFLASKM